jgi:hypothetical protein
MQRLSLLAGGLSSPAILIVVVWCAALASVAIGPLDYPGQPSPIVCGLVGTGLGLFLLAYHGGKLLFDRWFARQAQMAPLSARTLNKVVMAASLFGIVGIALIALDRTVLSGASNRSYAELLRCAPDLVDIIAIKRTALLYGGYGMFSLGFASVVLFLLKGEEITGWTAALAQLSIVSPVGYALLYAGRMPILFILVLIAAVMVIRLGQGRQPLPHGHHLLLKTAVAVGLFAVYSSAIWTTRQNFCVQMSPLIRELQEEKTRRDPARDGDRPVTGETIRPKKAGRMITATDLSKRLAAAAPQSEQKAEAAPQSEKKAGSIDTVLAMMLEAWNVKPRGYATSAIESSHLSTRGAMIGFSTYYYWTHGVRTIDIVWHARDKFTPQWGVYEIGVLSPFLRVFFPDSQQVATMEGEQQSAEVFGFFPTVWGAAFIDFGIVGAVIYISIWGGLAGWSAAGSKRSALMTPLLLLVFVLASILLSPVQGPLGIANSALVLVSMLVTGFVLDFPRLRSRSPQNAGELHFNSSVT